MLTEKGKREAMMNGTIITMLESGYDEKDIAEELGLHRIDVAQRLVRIATIIDDYIHEDWE